MDDMKDRIAERAYEIWERNGRQENSAEADWLAAEREITANAKLRASLQPEPADIEADIGTAKSKGAGKAASSPRRKAASRAGRTSHVTH